MTREAFEQFEGCLVKKSRRKKLIIGLIFLVLLGASIGTGIYCSQNNLTNSPFMGLVFAMTYIAMMVAIFALCENIHTVYHRGHYYTLYNKFSFTFKLYIDGKLAEDNSIGLTEREYNTPEGTLLTMTVNRGHVSLFFAGDEKPIQISTLLSPRFMEE